MLIYILLAKETRTLPHLALLAKYYYSWKAARATMRWLRPTNHIPKSDTQEYMKYTFAGVLVHSCILGIMKCKGWFWEIQVTLHCYLWCSEHTLHSNISLWILIAEEKMRNLLFLNYLIKCKNCLKIYRVKKKINLEYLYCNVNSEQRNFLFVF